jgi:hypothetical protein
VLAGLPAEAVAVDRASGLLPALEPVSADVAHAGLRGIRNGSTILHFIGSIGDRGRGVPHVRGVKAAVRDTEMVAYQRVSRSGGPAREVRITEMICHTEHNYLHLEGVADRWARIQPSRARRG